MPGFVVERSVEKRNALDEFQPVTADPIALKGVKFRPLGAAEILARNLSTYGLGGILLPLLGIKVIDMIVAMIGLGKPDFVIYNAGAFPANKLTSGMGSKTSVDLSFEDHEIVILGTEYAGEMKKGGVHLLFETGTGGP